MLAPLAAALATVLAFWPALGAGFVNWDDPANYVDNVHYRGLSAEHLEWMLTTSYMGPWQPLSWLSLAIDNSLWGERDFAPDPRGIHLTNVLLHAAAAAVFAVLARRLLARALARDVSPWLGALAAVLFAVHPLRVESVAWATERRDVLSGLFFLGAALAWVPWAPSGGGRPSWRALLLAGGLAAGGALLGRASLELELGAPLALRGPGIVGIALALASFVASAWCAAGAFEGAAGRGRGPYLAAFALFVLALLSKASGVALPMLLLVLDVWPFRRLTSGERSARALAGRALALGLEKAPFLGLAALVSAIAVWGQAGLGEAMLSFEDHTLAERALQTAFGLAFYAWKTFVPVGLTPMVELPPELSLGDPRFLLPAVLVALVTAAAVALRRRAPALLAVWAAYALTLAPLSGLAQAGAQLVADRYSYLPCLGFPLLVVGGLHRLATRGGGRTRPAWIGGALAAVLALGALTWRQAAVWSDSERLWTHQLAVRPESPAGFSFLAQLKVEEGRGADRREAKIAAWEEAIRLAERGYELGGSPRFLATLVDVRRLLAQVDPANRKAHLEAALRDSARALRGRDPGAAGVGHAHVQLLVELGRSEEASRAAAGLVRAFPQDAGAWSLAGRVALDAGGVGEAIGAFGRALELDRGLVSAWIGLVEAQESGGLRDEAIASLEQLLALQPDLEWARQRLARLKR